MTIQENEIAVNSKIVYKVSEASSLLGLGLHTTYGLIRSGTLRSIRVGRKIIVPAAAIHEFLSGNRQTM